MRIPVVFLALFFSYAISAENLEKTQKKELETQVKKITGRGSKA